MPRRPTISAMIVEAARELGLRAHLEPEWGFAGYIELPNGDRSYFRNQHVDLNGLGAAEVAKDKDQTAFFLRAAGFPTIEGATFFAREWATSLGSDRHIGRAYGYAKRLGLPVVVKPNSRSQGQGVAVAHSRADFQIAARHALRADRVILVQRFVRGRDYRIVVLDSQIISAYERLPLAVVGDGTSTVSQLLRRLQAGFTRRDRDTLLDETDYRIVSRLARLGMTMSTVVRQGRSVQLLDNANLSSGGTAVDVSSSIHPAYAQLAIKAATTMGLRLAGVDVISQGSITEPLASEHWIVEMNASPGLDHYATMGTPQAELVRRLYRQVVEALVVMPH